MVERDIVADRMLSMQFEESIAEMVEHGWDEEASIVCVCVSVCV